MLAQPHSTSATILQHLIIASDRTTARIWATNSPFARKDDLNCCGYRWGDGTDGQPKAWWIDVDDTVLDGELTFLRQEIYGWDADLLVKELTALERYKRSGVGIAAYPALA